MKKKVLLGWLAVMLLCGPCFAADLADGTYLLNDGTMEMTLMINKIPDGKYFVNGFGNSKAGKTCRVGDLAELKGGTLIVGTCKMAIDISENGFKLKDAGACAQCEAGAYVSGIYQKQ